MTEQAAVAAPTVNLALSQQEANQIIDALNVAVKAAPNALEAGSFLIPVAIKVSQALQAFNAAAQAA